jgi:hypothetical protein
MAEAVKVWVMGVDPAMVAVRVIFALFKVPARTAAVIDKVYVFGVKVTD